MLGLIFMLATSPTGQTTLPDMLVLRTVGRALHTIVRDSSGAERVIRTMLIQPSSARDTGYWHNILMMCMATVVAQRDRNLFASIWLNDLTYSEIDDVLTRSHGLGAWELSSSIPRQVLSTSSSTACVVPSVLYLDPGGNLGLTGQDEEGSAYVLSDGGKWVRASQRVESYPERVRSESQSVIVPLLAKLMDEAKVEAHNSYGWIRTPDTCDIAPGMHSQGLIAGDFGAWRDGERAVLWSIDRLYARWGPSVLSAQSDKQLGLEDCVNAAEPYVVCRGAPILEQLPWFTFTIVPKYVPYIRSSLYVVDMTTGRTAYLCEGMRALPLQ